MQYHQWQTMIDETKRIDKSLRNLSEEEVFARELRSIELTNFKSPQAGPKRKIRLAAERLWTLAGRPYYNVHPQLVRSLCKTNLDNIPAKYIEIPQGLETICFRFAEDVPIRFVENNTYATATDDRVMTSPIFCRSLLFGKIQASDLEYVDTRDVPKNDYFMLALDEGFRSRVSGVERSLCNFFMFQYQPEQTIPEVFETILASQLVKGLEKKLLEHMKTRLLNLFRVVITSGFLANTPDEQLVVPDILKDDTAEYERAKQQNDLQRMEFLVDRAKRRGKNGFNIGTNEMFVGESDLKRSEPRESTGRELSFSHLRGGHPHAVRYGEGKSKIKIKWFRTVRVREDLPFKIEG